MYLLGEKTKCRDSVVKLLLHLKPHRMFHSKSSINISALCRQHSVKSLLHLLQQRQHLSHFCFSLQQQMFLLLQQSGNSKLLLLQTCCCCCAHLPTRFTFSRSSSSLSLCCSNAASCCTCSI